MKNTQKGFIVSLLIAIIAVLVIGGGVYVYEQNKLQQPPQTQPLLDSKVIATDGLIQKNIPSSNTIVPNTVSSEVAKSNKIESKNTVDILMVSKNIGNLVFQRVDNGLEGISAKGLVKAKSARYDSFVVGVAQYSSNIESSDALADFVKKNKELARVVDFNAETKTYIVKNTSNQNLSVAWQSGMYLVFIAIIVPPEKLQNYDSDASQYFNKLQSEYINIYPTK